MAALAQPHWEAVTPETRRLLTVVGQLPMVRQFYLGGGTALALRLGHRISQDLDLFANIDTLDDHFRRSVVEALRPSHSINLLQDSPMGLILQVDGTAVSFFSYGYPLLESPDNEGGIQIASLMDIGLMKLDAVAGRGMRKDFYDLYFIARQVSLDELFARSGAKYPHTHGFGMRVLTALVDFEIADQQAEPTMLEPIEWDQVKEFFTAAARRLGREWLRPNQPGTL